MFVTLLAMKFAIAHGAEFVDEDVVARIKEEIMQRSNVGNTLACLSDVYGPRLTGTPRYLDIVEWAAGQLRDWGIENVWTERYGDDLRGWEIENYSATMTSPSFAQLNAQPVCCSASTDGVVTGSPLLLDIYDIEALRASSGKLRGRILLLPQVSEESHGVSGAWPDDRLEQAASRTNPVTPDSLDGPGSDISFVERLRQRDENDDQSDQELANILLQEGVAAVIRSSSAPAGIVNNRFDSGPVEFRRIGDPKPVPFFVIPRDQHSRLLALIDHGVAPQLSLNLAVRYYEDPALHVNLVAEIPGSDAELKDEIVFLGAHLDSVETGTGAADNGVGAATSMEVLRIIKAVDLMPRRTIRVGLWGGEEQGLLGSSAYVKKHIGDILEGIFSDQQRKISAYFNHDNNGHDICGIYLVGHEKIRRTFQAFLDPFADFGADTVTIENAGGTDILIFDAAQIPSFEWIHDPQYYFSHQLDTNLDVTSLVNIESVQQNAAIIASVVYHTAMRNEMLPREQIR